VSNDHRTELAAIKRFDQLVRYLRDPMGWPIEGGDFEELTFEYTPEELGIDSKNAAKIQEIKRLRPLSPNQPWGIFFVKFEPKTLPVVALRRILSTVALKKRASANAAERAAWAADDLLFISNYGAGEGRQISFAHFSRAEDGRDLPTLKVLGWDNLDTALHLDAVAKELTQQLAWPQDDADVEAWRTSWRTAFNLRHREVVTTSKELSIRLAELARSIRDRIKTALAIETGNGALTKLMKAFREALVHDLDPNGFADMYAQTIAYGLLSARIADPHKKTADDFAAHMRTNPFLRELMETFLKVGGRRGKAGGPGIDFDELGVSDIVNLLDDANMEAVVRDFGDRNRAEDPVMHFYELFLHEYDKQLKIQRGVFYTPQPVVSYIVRSVHELLQTEFGLADGLADITTWSEMLKKHPGLKLPTLTDDPGEKRTISPDEPFVQILDPATGTATFLVEVIDVIHLTLTAKWRQQRLTDDQQRAMWNDYVPKNLLPRLHAFELMMAPYAIAHMKVGLKLAETGYRFGTEERARIYLTNALEPWLKQVPLIGLAALAHEASAVNEIKRHKRFTVVIGNPPYSLYTANLTEAGNALIGPFRYVAGTAVRERGALQLEKNLQDDYVKFFGLAHAILSTSSVGVLGFISNHGYLNNRTLRGLRYSLINSFNKVWITELHGSASRSSAKSREVFDQNVFEIQQGVAVGIFLHDDTNAISVSHEELFGPRADKYSWLQEHSMGNVAWSSVKPTDPYYLLEPRDAGTDAEYRNGIPLDEALPVNSTGIVTARDALVVQFTSEEVDLVTSRLASLSTEEARRKFELGDDTKDWSVKRAQKDIKEGLKQGVTPTSIWYRPFDVRWTFYTGQARGFMCNPRRPVMVNLLGGTNLALCTNRQVNSGFRHVGVTRGLVTDCTLSTATKERTYLFPLYLFEDSEALLSRESRRLNLSSSFLDQLAAALDLPQDPHGLPTGLTPEDIFHYIYAALHSPGYRSRYADFLKIDFPRLPLTGSLELFRLLARLGGKLVALHLLESSELGYAMSEFIGGRSPEVEKISWSENTVWIDKAQTIGFCGVGEDVWSFYIGGYQVCEKWLKDRKGRTLSKDDIAHYQKIVVALAGTMRLMKEIDEVIDAHGGWPGAFAQGNGAALGLAIKSRDAEKLAPLAHPKAAPGAYQTNPFPVLEAAEPEALPYETVKSAERDARRPNSDELDREELICRIRQLFGDGQERERAKAIDELARELGYERTGHRIHEELDNALRTAVRRRILASESGALCLFARTIEQHDREFLKDQFLAALLGRQWIEREDAVRAFARWMGFRRTGPTIEDAARSLINGLLREGRLEREGAQIRRFG
jgi:hypothetical protein